MKTLIKGGQTSAKELDSKIKKLFDFYSNRDSREPEQTPKLATSSHISPPPDSWFKPPSPDDLNLDRKLSRRNKIINLFANIPTFNNESSYTARDFLLSLNYVISEWRNCILPSELLSIAISKLSAKIRGILMAQNKLHDLNSFYSCLSVLFDSSESKRQAFNLLTNYNKKFDNISKFLSETMRLLGLIYLPEQNEVDVLLQSVQTGLPAPVCEKIIEHCESIEERTGRSPRIGELITYINRNKSKFNELMSQKRNRAMLVETNEPCIHCNRSTHKSTACFKIMKCEGCGRIGHPLRLCFNNKKDQKTRCRLCFDPKHTAVNCNTYQGIEPVSSACSYCLDSLKIRLFHPEVLCKLRNQLPQ